MRVERYGFNEQGYVTRVVLVCLCAASVRSDKRAGAAFYGCGVLWTVAEAILTLTSVREGVVALRERGYAVAIAAAAVRGFSEAAAVVVMGWWEFASAPPAVAAALAILAFDASLHDSEAPLLSERDVGAPLGLLVTLGCSALYLWRPSSRWCSCYHRSRGESVHPSWRASPPALCGAFFFGSWKQ